MIHWDMGDSGQLSLWVKEVSHNSIGGQDWPEARSG